MLRSAFVFDYVCSLDVFLAASGLLLPLDKLIPAVFATKSKHDGC